MTEGKKQKKAARERAAKTGESYSQARMNLRKPESTFCPRELDKKADENASPPCDDCEKLATDTRTDDKGLIVGAVCDDHKHSIEVIKWVEHGWRGPCSSCGKPWKQAVRFKIDGCEKAYIQFGEDGEHEKIVSSGWYPCCAVARKFFDNESSSNRMINVTSDLSNLLRIYSYWGGLPPLHGGRLKHAINIAACQDTVCFETAGITIDLADGSKQCLIIYRESEEPKHESGKPDAELVQEIAEAAMSREKREDIPETGVAQYGWKVKALPPDRLLVQLRDGDRRILVLHEGHEVWDRIEAIRKAEDARLEKIRTETPQGDAKELVFSILGHFTPVVAIKVKHALCHAAMATNQEGFWPLERKIVYAGSSDPAASERLMTVLERLPYPISRNMVGAVYDAAAKIDYAEVHDLIGAANRAWRRIKEKYPSEVPLGQYVL